MLLIGDVFEGFLHHSIEFSFTPESYDEAVMDGKDRRVMFDKPLDDVFAHLGIEAHEAQTCTAANQVADLRVSTFDACQQFRQDIIREAIRVGCLVEFASEGFEQGLFIACIEAEQKQQLCDVTAMIRIVNPANM